MPKVYRPAAWLLTFILFLFASLPITAQNSTVKPKSGPESCDGALDIVPSKSATFMRKRRPSNKKPARKTESKSETKSAS